MHQTEPNDGESEQAHQVRERVFPALRLLPRCRRGAARCRPRLRLEYRWLLLLECGRLALLLLLPHSSLLRLLRLCLQRLCDTKVVRRRQLLGSAQADAAELCRGPGPWAGAKVQHWRSAQSHAV